MTTLRQILYGLALLAALGVLFWTQHLRTQAENATAALATNRQRQTEEKVERQATTIATLNDTLTEQRQAQTALQETQAKLRQGLATRQLQIEELKRENQELRQWADQPLPAAARRLRQRPAITGATGYRDWLSRRDALHPERSGPDP
jgi:LysB family phage lysis regulatory protein